MKKVFLAVTMLLALTGIALAQGETDSLVVPTPVFELSKVLGVDLLSLVGIGALVSLLLQGAKRLIPLAGPTTLIASGVLSLGYGAVQFGFDNILQLVFASACLFGFSTGWFETFKVVLAKWGVGTTTVKK